MGSQGNLSHDHAKEKEFNKTGKFKVTHDSSRPIEVDAAGMVPKAETQKSSERVEEENEKFHTQMKKEQKRMFSPGVSPINMQETISISGLGQPQWMDNASSAVNVSNLNSGEKPKIAFRVEDSN